MALLTFPRIGDGEVPDGEEDEGLRRGSFIARVASIAAVLVAAVVVAVLLLGGNGSDYQVKARFANASQLVKGNLVQVAGRPVGEVESITVTPDGRAEIGRA